MKVNMRNVVFDPSVNCLSKCLLRHFSLAKRVYFGEERKWLVQSGNWSAEIGRKGLVWKSWKVGSFDHRVSYDMPGRAVDLD